MQKTSTLITTKVWLCILAVSFLVLLAACGGTTTTPTPTPTATDTPTPTTAPTSTPTTAATNTPTPAPPSSGSSVSIVNFAFSPASLTVKVGTKVTWTNNDKVTHTVTADQGAFSSGPISPGSTFSFTFTQAGTFTYHCSIHPFMKATIVVQ